MTFVHQYVPLQIEEHARYKDRQRRYLEASSDAQIQMRLLAEKRETQRKAREEWNRRARQEQERYQMQCLSAVAALERGIAEALRPNPTVEEILKSIRLETRANGIIKATSQRYGLEKDEIFSRRHLDRVVRPRQVSMYLIREMTPRSLPEIGRLFGGKDHTTVLHATRKIESLIQNDPDLAHLVSSIRAEVESAAHERAARALRITIEQVRAAVSDA